ncbi:hypothetical protein ABIA39_003472 [Nocardia sp. GAS34]|uniref:hypothetical protein n=1 Tax=unclassified Nocardia TaxID=2637762 RepID=UPI003D255D16
MSVQDTGRRGHHVTIDLSPAPHTLELRLCGAGLFSIDAPIKTKPTTEPEFRTWLTEVLTEHLGHIVDHLATIYRCAQDSPGIEPPF